MERLLAKLTVLARRSDAQTAVATNRRLWPLQLTERHLIVTLVVAMLSLLAFFVRPVLRGRIPVHGDLGMLLLVFRDFYAHCLCQGDSFDWMPQIFGGYDLTGGGACGTYHPLNWLLYRWLPLDVAFNCEVFLPIAVLGAGTLVFLRRYINMAGACLGAIVASLSLVFIVYLHTPQMTGVLAHIPWLLAAIDWAVRSRTTAQRRLASAAIALVTGSEMLLAFPQAWWYSAIAAALFAVCLLVGQRAGWGAWLAVTVGVILGLGLGAVQIFPMYAFFEVSTRAVADRMTLPFPPVEPASFWDIAAPYRSWNGFIPNYFGAAPLVLVLWWFTARRIHPDETPATAGKSAGSNADRTARTNMVRQLSQWAVLLAVVSGALSLGLRGKLYYLQLMLPGVGSFRSPWRILVITQFSVAILAGIAFAHLVNLVRSGRKVPGCHLVLPWLAAEVALLLTVWYDAQGEYGLFGHFFLCLGPLLIGGAALGVTLAARGRPVGLFLLVLVTAIDFGTFSVSNPGSGAYFTHHLPSYRQFVARCSGPPTAGEGRVFYKDDRDGLISRINSLGYHGYRAIYGYSALYPQQCLDYGDLNALRVAEVAWVWQPKLSANCVPGSSPSGEYAGGWLRVPHPLPRARLVSRAVLSTAPEKDLKKIDVDSTVLVSHPLDLVPSRPGTARLQEDRPGRIGVEVEAPQRQLLVVSESYHDGWRVRVDGQPTALQRVNGDFVGCVVESGKHRVEFAYQPASLWWGKMVSLATLAVVLAVSFGPTVGWLGGWRSSAPLDKEAGVKTRG